MPVPLQHDPDVLRARLGAWLSARSADRARVEVGPPEVPAAGGFSHETVLVDTRWTRGGRAWRRPLVVRLAPTRYRAQPRDRFAAQCRLLAVLDRDTDVPVPAVHGYEDDPGVLGAPFVVMDRVDGYVPADLPSYHREGELARSEPPAREAVWWAALSVLPAVHRLDVAALGLADIGLGPGTPAGALREWEDDRDFYGAEHPAVADAFAWLHEHLPSEHRPPVLLWGDARLGNLVFAPGPRTPGSRSAAGGPALAGGRVAAVLDWEMAALGDPESDLAWFLHLDRHLSDGVGAPRLTGLPSRASSVAAYERMTGRQTVGLAFQTVFAAVRFALIAARVTRLVAEHGVLPPGADLPLARNAARLLARTLAEAADTPGDLLPGGPPPDRHDHPPSSALEESPWKERAHDAPHARRPAPQAVGPRPLAGGRRLDRRGGAAQQH